MDNAVDESGICVEVDAQLIREALLADVSASFLSASVEKLDSEILDALGRFCVYLGLERCTLWQSTPERPGLYFLTHLHQPADAPAAAPKAELHEYFPWAARELDYGVLDPDLAMKPGWRAAFEKRARREAVRL